MKLTYDPKYNVAYLCFREAAVEVETIHLSEELNVDVAPDGKVYGIELLNANEQLASPTAGVLQVVNGATGESAKINLTG